MKIVISTENIITIIIIAVAFFLFYWYEIKPSQTVKFCQNSSIIETKNSNSPGRESAIYFYGKCMREHGIDKQLNN